MRDAGLWNVNTISALAPSLRPNLEQLAAEDLAQLELFDDELSPYVEYLHRTSSTAEKTLRLGLEVAYLSHLNQRRRSGEAFIMHPVCVASILAQSRRGSSVRVVLRMVFGILNYR